MKTVFDNKELARVLKMMERAGTGDHTPHYTAVTRIERFGVREEEADLFAVAAEYAYQNGLAVSWKMWQFAQYVGEEDFRTLTDTFEVHLDSVFGDLRKLLDAGMTAEEACEYRLADGGYRNNNLSAYDVLSLWRQKIPGAYHAALCDGIPWPMHPSVQETMDLWFARVPAEAASAMRAAKMEVPDIIRCFEDGIPLDYALELAGVH